MPRINIEERLWADHRLEALRILMSNKYDPSIGYELALGCLARAFRLSQDYWAKGEEFIPCKDWDLFPNFSFLEQVGLAERLDEGIYVKGSRESHQWLLQKRAAGKNSAKARRDRFGSAQPKNKTDSSNGRSEVVRESFERNSTDVEPLSLSLPLTLSTNSITESNYNTSSLHILPDSAKKASSSCKSKILEIWNNAQHPFAKASLTKKRSASLNARWKEKPDEAYWHQVIERIAASDYCRGNGRDGWTANIEFLMKPDTHVKVMEGQYDNRPKPKSTDGYRSPQYKVYKEGDEVL